MDPHRTLLSTREVRVTRLLRFWSAKQPPGAFGGHALTMNQLSKRNYFSKNPNGRAELKVDVIVAAF